MLRAADLSPCGQCGGMRVERSNRRETVKRGSEKCSIKKAPELEEEFGLGGCKFTVSQLTIWCIGKELRRASKGIE